MKIVFLNIWNCTVHDAILDFFHEHVLDTDVFCLQEAYDTSREMYQDIFADYQSVTDYKYVNENDDFALATYVRNDIEMQVATPLLKEIPLIGMVLYTRLSYQDRILNICNVHGISKPGDKMDNEYRIRQSSEILKHNRSLIGTQIIGGDMNLELNTSAVRLFEEEGYLNLIREYEIATTRNRLIWERYPENKQYYSDYVFTTPDITVKRFVVPDLEVSDHQPMILEFE